MVKLTGNLLIVGGDAKNREMLCRNLSERGFNAAGVGSGSEAASWIKANQVELVLLNSDTPDAAGIDVLKELRKTFTPLQLPIIAATEKIDDSDVVAALLDAGANDYVAYPTDFPVVLASIQTQIERKRAEETLNKHEELFTLAMRVSSDGLWDWDLEKDKIHFSQRWKSMIGEKDDTVSDNPEEWFKRIHPDDIERVRRDIQAHIDGSTPQYEDEYRLLHKDGEYLWMFGRGLAIRDKNGKPYRMAGWQTDITRGKQVDFLTGLPNRVLFMEHLARSFENAGRERTRTTALIYLDLDNFKLINDSLGHTVGDQLLVAVARRLEDVVHSSGLFVLCEHSIIARMGGDEFVILVDNASTPMEVIHIANKILNGIGTSFLVQDREIFTAASIGVAFYNNTYKSPEAMMQAAGIAMNRSKLAGKGRFEIFDTNMLTASTKRLQLDAEFRYALERNEFEPYYQAIISIKTGRICGFESLVRWRNPSRGFIPPYEFIPLAEETGLIIPLEKYMIEAACRQTYQWQCRFAEDPPLSINVNISARYFLQSDLLVYCHALLENIALARNTLVLEVTESTIMRDYEASIKLMSKLKSMGIRISIDDFGTGYSSLSYLHKFPFDTLKIDQSFISRFEEDGAIVRAILMLGHTLGMKVVAEGVETLEHVNKLKELGCDYLQGYYFSKPIPAHDATALLERQSGGTLMAALA